jgi:NAD+ synthase (glutamine-hydrolysing)
VPSEASRLQQDCYEAYNIQVAGLVQRLRAIGSQRVVIGVSGGLDSTHALIVAAKAMDLLSLPRANILAYTMPGFATGMQSKQQAWALMQALEVSCQELDIKPAATQMLKDLGHPFGQGKPVYDVTFENVQAGLRTDDLFRLANHYGGL